MKSLGLVTAAVMMFSFGAAVGQKELNTVSPSTWGGAGVRVVVGEKSVSIQYDCAAGEISKPLGTDRRGKFVANGFHRYLPPGPVRPAFQTKPLPARYEGKVSAGAMTYRVFLIETNELIGQFSAGRDKEARIAGCR
jgi:hypothetical protein